MDAESLAGAGVVGPPGSGKTRLAASLGLDYSARTLLELDNYAALARRYGRRVVSLVGLANACPLGLPRDPLEAARACRERRREGCRFYLRSAELEGAAARLLGRRAVGPSEVVELARRLGACPYLLARSAALRGGAAVAMTHHMFFSVRRLLGDRLVFFDEAHAVFDAFTRVAWQATRWDEVQAAAAEERGLARRALMAAAAAIRRGDADALREVAGRGLGRAAPGLRRLFAEGVVGGGYVYIPEEPFALPERYVLATSTPPPEPVWRRLVRREVRLGGGVETRFVVDTELSSRARERGAVTYRAYAGKVAAIRGRCGGRVLVVAVSKGFARALAQLVPGGGVDWSYFGGREVEGVNVDYGCVVLAGYPEPPPEALESPTARLLLSLGAGVEEYRAWLAAVAVVQAAGRAGRFGPGTVYAIDDRYPTLLRRLGLPFEEEEIRGVRVEGGELWRGFI